MAGLRRRAALFLLKAVAATLLVTVALVLPLRWFAPATSSFMVQNWLGQARLSARVHYDWVPRTAISREAARAVIASEDQKFFSHPGFDVESIRKVWQGNARGKPLRGASTISQQVAKNLWLWPGRSWFRKGLEAWFTLWLEWLLPKDRILELYLNVAQFGPDLFGVEAAGKRYFGKPAGRLNRAEAARLAAVLPNPVLLRAGKPSRYVLRRQAWIERQTRNLADELPVGAFGRR